MVELATLQAVSYIMGSLGVFVAAVYYVMTLRVQQANARNTLETRKAQTYMQYWEKTNTDEWQRDLNELLDEWSFTDFDDFWRKYGRDNNPDQWIKYRRIAYYYEHIGILLKEDLIDPKLIYDFDLTPIRFWEKFEPAIRGFRERFEPPPKGQTAEWIEDMYYVLKKIQIEDRKDVPARVARRKQIRDTLNKTMNPP
jgi:hypothetical protein